MNTKSNKRNYWKNNIETLNNLLNKGYTPQKDPVVFLNAFPGKTMGAISRATRRYCRNTLDILQGKLTIEDISEVVKLPPPNQKDFPKILILDIETSPMEIYLWDLKMRGKYIPPQNIKVDWALLSWSAKWLCGSEIYSQVVNITEAKERRDKRIMPRLHDLMDEADIIVGHNVERFDIRKINTRFIINGFLPPSPYQIIDTYKIARKYFLFSSNKMSYLNKQLELRDKLETNFELWKRCVNNDKEALEYMEKYNRYDTVATEDMYFIFRPWIKSHPNIGLYMEVDKAVCHVCGSEELTNEGFYFTPCGKFNALRCGICGSISRERTNIYEKAKRPVLTRSTAR